MKKVYQLDPRVLSTLMALCCMTFVSLAGYFVSSQTAYPFLVASMGAASVIMFCAPNSPMATYRAFVLGNLLSAVIGVTVGLLPLPIYLLAPLAVSSAIGCMHLFKCQHPPGGATALVAVIGGTQISELGYLYALFPVALNVGTFFAFVSFQRGIVGKMKVESWAEQSLSSLNQAVDRDTARLYSVPEIHERFGLDLDIKPEELEKAYAYLLTQERLGVGIYQPLGALAEKQSPTIEYGDSLEHAWDLMRKQNTDFLIVLDKSRRVDGRVSLRRILETAKVPQNEKDPQRVAEILSGSAFEEPANFPESVGLLLEPVSIEREETKLSTALEKGSSYPIVVIDPARKYVGVVLG